MYAKLHFENLNSDHCFSHSTNTYTGGMTITPKMRGSLFFFLSTLFCYFTSSFRTKNYSTIFFLSQP